MGVGSSRNDFALAVPIAAAIGNLQPGIDPVFLTLLSRACDVPIAAHGLIVGGTQAGAAAGSLAVWWLGSRLTRGTMIAATVGALACSLATSLANGVATTLAIRCAYGVMMGAIYAQSMAAYAASQPHRAYGAVFFLQLVLATLLSLALPQIEMALGPGAAIAALALAPAAAFIALMLTKGRAGTDRSALLAQQDAKAPVPAAGWALAIATFAFICSTMLVWSFSAALATTAGIGDRTIGHAVAIGSVVGALTAIAVMRERLLVPLPATAVMAGAALSAPLLLTTYGGDKAFALSIILLNIGSTAIIIRCSGLATAASENSRFRTFVACVHSLGMICGPTLGSIMMMLAGPRGLAAGLVVMLGTGLVAIGWAILAGAQGDRRRSIIDSAGYGEFEQAA